MRELQAQLSQDATFLQMLVWYADCCLEFRKTWLEASLKHSTTCRCGTVLAPAVLLNNKVA